MGNSKDLSTNAFRALNVSLVRSYFEYASVVGFLDYRSDIIILWESITNVYGVVHTEKELSITICIPTMTS